MGEMEREFSNVDENDPRAMGRMMRRMADLTGEKIDGEMEEVRSVSEAQHMTVAEWVRQALRRERREQPVTTAPESRHSHS